MIHKKKGNPDDRVAVHGLGHMAKAGRFGGLRAPLDRESPQRIQRGAFPRNPKTHFRAKLRNAHFCHLKHFCSTGLTIFPVLHLFDFFARFALFLARFALSCTFFASFRSPLHFPLHSCHFLHVCCTLFAHFYIFGALLSLYFHRK